MLKSAEIANCNVRQEKVKIFKTHTQENFNYYTKYFKDMPNVKVVYEQMTPEEELERLFDSLRAEKMMEEDIYR